MPRRCGSAFCRFLDSLVRESFRATRDPESARLFYSLWQEHSFVHPDFEPGTIASLRTTSEMSDGTCDICMFMLDHLVQECRQQGSTAVSSSTKVIVVGYENCLVMEACFDDFEVMDGTVPFTFVNDTPHAHVDTARTLHTILQQTDYDRVQNWIQHCEFNHENSCSEGLSWDATHKQDDSVLRVIDLEEQCLTYVDWLDLQKSSYIALSYVWGSADPPRLMKEQEGGLRKQGALREKLKTAPSAIQDAMEVSRRLHIRYFWFDSLCIVQDDPDDLTRWIDKMNLIYERAHLTIVLAHAPDASANLPGISTPRMPQRRLLIDENIGIISKRRMTADVLQSKWSTRGWTYQEQVLSRRTLTFTQTQMHYDCYQSSFCEESCTDIEPQDHKGTSKVNYGRQLEHHSSDISNDIPESLCKIYRIYFKSVMSYSFRHLSFDTDTLRAFTGLIQRTSVMTGGATILQGLPTAILPISMMFLLQPRHSGQFLQRKSAFPSYSWAGWDAHTFWTDLNSFIVGYKYSVTLRWLREANWIEFRTLTTNSRQDSISMEHGDRNAIAIRLRQRYGITTSATHETYPPPTNMSWAKYPCLYFSTLMIEIHVAHSSVAREHDSIYEDVLTYDILDKHDQLCGAVELDKLENIDNISSSVSLPSSPSRNYHKVRCLLISERWILGVSEREQTIRTNGATASSHEDDDDGDNDEGSTEHHQPDETRSEQQESTSYNILVVEEMSDHSGIYERRGLGWVQSIAVKEASELGEAHWRRIILA